MKVLITSNSHRHYDRVGQIVGKEDDGRYKVRIPNAQASIFTLVQEGQFKPIKQQD